MRKLHFWFLVATCWFFACGPVHAQKALAVGNVAPALQATANGKPFPAFQPGRVYVVEFWATWCGPCLAAFEHLNELTREMKDQPVTFVSLTDDSADKVERMLKVRRLDTQVALDRNGKTFAAYGVRLIPHTIIVGTDGKIAALTNPQAITPAALREVIAGKPANLPIQTNIAADLAWDKQITTETPEVLAQIVVQRSNADGGASRFRPNSGQIVGDGLDLGSLIQLAYGAESYEVKSTLPRDNPVRYRVSVRAPDGKDATARTLLASVLPTLTPFTAQWTEEEAVVPVLRRIPGTPELKTMPSKLDGMARSGDISYIGVPFKSFVSALGAFAYRGNVQDETGYTGIYDVKLVWTPGDANSLEAALKAQGLQVSQEKRMVRRLIVQPGPTP